MKQNRPNENKKSTVAWMSLNKWTKTNIDEKNDCKCDEKNLRLYREKKNNNEIYLNEKNIECIAYKKDEWIHMYIVRSATKKQHFFSFSQLIWSNCISVFLWIYVWPSDIYCMNIEKGKKWINSKRKSFWNVRIKFACAIPL